MPKGGGDLALKWLRGVINTAANRAISTHQCPFRLIKRRHCLQTEVQHMHIHTVAFTHLKCSHVVVSFKMLWLKHSSYRFRLQMHCETLKDSSSISWSQVPKLWIGYRDLSLCSVQNNTVFRAQWHIEDICHFVVIKHCGEYLMVWQDVKVLHGSSVSYTVSPVARQRKTFRVLHTLRSSRLVIYLMSLGTLSISKSYTLIQKPQPRLSSPAFPRDCQAWLSWWWFIIGNMVCKLQFYQWLLVSHTHQNYCWFHWGYFCLPAILTDGMPNFLLWELLWWPSGSGSGPFTVTSIFLLALSCNLGYAPRFHAWCMLDKLLTITLQVKVWWAWR